VAHLGSTAARDVDASVEITFSNAVSSRAVVWVGAVVRKTRHRPALYRSRPPEAGTA
jgi:hypothetical protein